MEEKSVIKDCGFDEAMAKNYINAIENENYLRQLQLLKEQRGIMLNEMHAAAKKIDCIDYLISECKKKVK